MWCWLRSLRIASPTQCNRWRFCGGSLRRFCRLSRSRRFRSCLFGCDGRFIVVFYSLQFFIVLVGTCCIRVTLFYLLNVTMSGMIRIIMAVRLFFRTRSSLVECSRYRMHAFRCMTVFMYWTVQKLFRKLTRKPCPSIVASRGNLLPQRLPLDVVVYVR